MNALDQVNPDEAKTELGNIAEKSGVLVSGVAALAVWAAVVGLIGTL